MSKPGKNEAFTIAMGQAHQAISVYERSPEFSALIHETLAGVGSDGQRRAVEWLAGTDRFFLVSMGRSRQSFWAASAIDLEDLVDHVLPRIAEEWLAEELKSTIILVQSDQPSLASSIIELWGSLGGLTY